MDNVNYSDAIDRNALNDADFEGTSLGALHSMETIKNYLQGCTVLIDIGAYKGLFARLANAFHPFKRTFCFEPNSDLLNLIKLNNKNLSITVENLALASYRGEATYYRHQSASMNSIVECKNEVLRSEFPWDNPDFIEQEKIMATTLDLYFEGKSLESEKTFIKIDTQGNELDILRGAVRTLARTEALLLEHIFVSPYKTKYTFADVIAFLDDHSFMCHGALSIQKRPSNKISAVDFLFCKTS